MSLSLAVPTSPMVAFKDCSIPPMISTGVRSSADEMLGIIRLTFITVLGLWIALAANVLAQQPSGPDPKQLEPEVRNGRTAAPLI
jgi:hypothetical protein